eukprot:TRINITY_DN6408_c0_g1_i1.p1 TRINITY_DN6408_c0_g1~~TRINITY_DN6408_c0_g1_i1.p1  ORF type:complete len:187 (-),score=25.21 TRINITY_DN6408_c0_g1_i1:7-567(-)
MELPGKRLKLADHSHSEPVKDARSELPLEVWELIWQFLNLADSRTVSCVCRAWRAAVWSQVLVLPGPLRCAVLRRPKLTLSFISTYCVRLRELDVSGLPLSPHSSDWRALSCLRLLEKLRIDLAPGAAPIYALITDGLPQLHELFVRLQYFSDDNIDEVSCLAGRLVGLTICDGRLSAAGVVPVVR